jgi:hypothetical protein
MLCLHLKDGQNHTIGSPSTGKGTKFSGIYWEICDKVKNHGWTKEHASNGRNPFAYHENQWVGYDDPHQAFE